MAFGYHPAVAKLLLNLRDVPDDEAADIRALLEERAIAFYETPPSRWGISAGGIWIRHAEDFAAARGLMAEYHVARFERVRAEYRIAQEEGTARTLWTSLREDPLLAIAALLGIAFVILVLALPFLLLGR